MLTSLIALSLGASALANLHDHAGMRRHHDVAKRAQGDVQLFKRFDNARFTFYDVGLGACGQVNVPSDFIVALNSDQYGGGYPGPNCFKKIEISYGGKSTQATIMDECPGCPYGGLDFSRGLFDFFAPESVGVLYGTWNFVGGGDSGGGDSSPPTTTHHTTTTHYTPPPSPTTTWTPPPKPSTTSQKPSSSSKPPPPSSSVSHSSSSSAPAPSINYETGAASGLAVPTGAPVAQQGTLDQFNLAMIEMGGLLNAAHRMQ